MFVLVAVIAPITRPPTTEERMMFAPSEMFSSPAPSRNVTAAASKTISAPSTARSRKLPAVQKTWPGERIPKTTTRITSTRKTQTTVRARSTRMSRVGSACPSTATGLSACGSSATAIRAPPHAVAQVADHDLDDLRHAQSVRRAVERDGAAHEHDDAVRDRERARQVV